MSFCHSVISATPVTVIPHPVLCSCHIIIIICSYAESHWTCQTFCLTLVVSPPFFRFPPGYPRREYFSLIRISLCLKCLKYGLALYSFRSMGIMILNYAFWRLLYKTDILYLNSEIWKDVTILISVSAVIKLKIFKYYFIYLVSFCSVY